ncbi:hypothetical protein PMAYCL1PPCAC_32047, partial [Pristionchus mayeri]
LTVASIFRSMLYATGSTVTFLIALDRFVATHWWSWYERQGRTTICVALLLLIFSEVFSVMTSYCSIFRLFCIYCTNNLKNGNKYF